MFTISALAVTAAVLIYPIAIESEAHLTPHEYGPGYVLGWLAIFVFLASSLCMCLDEIMRGITKGYLAVQKHRNINTRV